MIQAKQHLAALIPVDRGLVLNLLRWGADIKSWSDLALPAAGTKATGLTDAELKMATQLVKDMTKRFKAEDYRDSFKDEVMALVHRKVASGETETVVQPAPGEAQPKSADIIDLTELLKRSLKGGAAAGTKAPEKTAPPKTPPAKKKRAG